MVVDTAYASRLPFLGFDIRQILKEYAAIMRLKYVRSEMPPEFDVLAEMRSVLSIYETYIAAEGLEKDVKRPAAPVGPGLVGSTAPPSS
jgi:hypothetical protein